MFEIICKCIFFSHLKISAISRIISNNLMISEIVLKTNLFKIGSTYCNYVLNTYRKPRKNTTFVSLETALRLVGMYLNGNNFSPLVSFVTQLITEMEAQLKMIGSCWHFRIKSMKFE